MFGLMYLHHRGDVEQSLIKSRERDDGYFQDGLI